MILWYHNTKNDDTRPRIETRVMANILKISEAASLALHAGVLLAAQNRPISNRQIATVLRASEAHLHKVMRRLTGAELVSSATGPGGGFALARDANKITLLEIFEAIEGPLSDTKCLLAEPLCDGKACILGGLIHQTNQQVRNYLQNTNLAQLAAIFKGAAIGT